MSRLSALWMLGLDWTDVVVMHRDLLAGIARANQELIDSWSNQ